MDYTVSRGRDRSQRNRGSGGDKRKGKMKVHFCFYGSSAATCLAWGDNAVVIDDGIVAHCRFPDFPHQQEQRHPGYK